MIRLLLVAEDRVIEAVIPVKALPVVQSDDFPGLEAWPARPLDEIGIERAQGVVVDQPQVEGRLDRTARAAIGVGLTARQVEPESCAVLRFGVGFVDSNETDLWQ